MGLKLAAGVLVLLVFLLAAFWALAKARETQILPLAAPAWGREIATPHGRMFVQLRGPEHGYPIVLVPGAGAWSGFWADVAEALAARGYRVAAIDLPPFGYSERRPDIGYSRRMQSERLVATIGALGFKRPIVVGHSYGAGAVVETALRRAESLGGAVLVCAALDLAPDDTLHPLPPAALEWLLAQAWLLEPAVAATATNPLLTRRLLRAMLYRKAAADDKQIGILQQPLTLADSSRAFSAWLRHVVLPERDAMSADPRNYANIRLPFALVWGARDPITPLEQGERLARLIPGARLTTLDDVGHIPHIEDRIALLGALAREIERIQAGI